MTLPGLFTPSRPRLAVTWTQAISAYLDDYDGSQASVNAFRRDLEVLAGLFPGRAPASLTVRDARWAVLHISKRVKASTAARRHGTWRAFYTWMAQEKGWVTDTPFRFGFADLTPRHYRPPKYLSRSQADALLAAAEADPGANFLVRLALYTGMKPLEIDRLRVQDLDEPAHLVTVRGRRNRVVPVLPDLFPAYDAFVEEVLGGQRPLATVEAVPFSTRWMELRLAKVARQVEPTIGFCPTFSTLRWTRAVWDLRNGVPEDRVRRKLGYSEKSWKMHARRLLAPLVPHPREGLSI
jgi:integrase